MDLNEGLSVPWGKNVIWVILDRFTKYSHFIYVSHPYTTTSLAKVFLDVVYKLHGLPFSIVSDKDKILIDVSGRNYSSLWELNCI